MERAYFIRSEAQADLGHQVEALADIPSVPRGSRGTVVKAQPYSGANWVLTIEWRLPKRSAVVDLLVGDVSLNLFSRSKPVTDQFCKSEYQSLLKVLPRH
jgi:hypothetical protein